MRKNDPYTRALGGYASDATHLKALKRLGFIPYTPEDGVDEFLMAVREP